MMNQPQIRDETGRFLPGVSGNPGGRPTSGLATMIRDATEDGAELVTFMMSIFRGEQSDDIRIRADAATWLADRAFGKPSPNTGAAHECETCAAIDISDMGAKEILREKLKLRVERENSDLPLH